MNPIKKLIRDLKEEPFKTTAGIVAGIGLYYLINYIYTQFMTL